MEIVNITGSAKDDFNIIGANAFCDNAERNIVNKAQGKYVDHSDISEKNEKGFETFLETVVRKDDKGKTGFSDLMDQAMAKAFRKEPLPEDPVEATKERRSRLKAMDDSAKVIDRAGEFVGSVSDISRITKTDMTNEVSSMKRSVEHQKKKLRAEKIGMLDDVVDRMSHSKRWRSNSDEYKTMLDYAKRLQTTVDVYTTEYESASAERKKSLDNRLQKALDDTSIFTKDYIDKKTGGNSDKKFWTDKGLERTELARSLQEITKNLSKEFYPPKAREAEQQVNRSKKPMDTTFSDKSKRYADEYLSLGHHSDFKACEDSIAKITALNMLLDLKQDTNRDPDKEDTFDSSRLYSDPVVNFLSERVKECPSFRNLDFDKCTDYDKAQERYSLINGEIIAPASEGYPINAKYMDSVKRDMFQIQNFKQKLKECVDPSLSRQNQKKIGMDEGGLNKK